MQQPKKDLPTKEVELLDDTLTFKGKDLKKGDKFKATDGQLEVLVAHNVKVKVK